MLSTPTSSSFTFLHARNLAHGLQKSVFQFNNICLFIFTNTTDWEGSFHFMNTNLVFKIANIPPSGSADEQAGQERWFTVVGLLMSSPMSRKPWVYAAVRAVGVFCDQAEWEHLKAPHEGQLHVGRVAQGMGRGLALVAGTVVFTKHLDTSGWPFIMSPFSLETHMPCSPKSPTLKLLRLLQSRGGIYKTFLGKKLCCCDLPLPSHPLCLFVTTLQKWLDCEFLSVSCLPH